MPVYGLTHHLVENGAADLGEFPYNSPITMTSSVNNLGSSRQMSEEGPSELAEDSQLESEELDSEELER